ncbi:MAG: RNA polymerase factor sigma-54 [Fibrobacteria bacterium]|nr:RNA polymerase factor sigma-54 [Fibrobacteria bacterium]
MQLGLDLNVGLKLEQKLSPQMIQSLKLLQVTALQLEALVSQELQTNPLLEQTDEIEDKVEETEEMAGDNEKETAPENEKELEEIKVETDKDDIDWEKFFEDGFDPGYKRSEDNSDKDNKFERLPVAVKSFQDQLFFQLLHTYVKPEIKTLVEYLINSLDDDGYLRPDIVLDDLNGSGLPVESEAEIGEIQAVISGEKTEFQVSKNVREAFHLLWKMEPAGIGARNLRECLLLQLQRTGSISPLARKILEDEFEALEKLKISAIAKKLEVGPEEVQKAIKEIGTLEPRPGRLLGESVSTTIIPDLVIEIIDGEIILLFNDKLSPSLHISRNYSNLLKKGSNATVSEKKYVREKLNSASWLIRAIEQRKTTMMKVMNAIIENQPDFFSKGAANLKPLILQDVADNIKMHISTVSRVINGKYVQTPHGIFELKYFFTSGISKEDGADVSSIKVKDEIKILIDSEEPKKPLSDQKIADILKKKGFEVARRTVAKYRDQLNILPARLRKQF